MAGSVSRYSVRNPSTFSRKKRWRKKVISGKNRFRALVRLVIANRTWLDMLNLEIKDFGDNVMANVKLIQSKAAKGEMRLGLARIILRKQPQLRTEEEKDTLFRLLGDLKCFRKYPEEVRRELVAHTYFQYFGANRTLMRQDHYATFMAVVLTGELAIYITYEDPVFKKAVTERKANIMPGNMVGEVSLIYSMPRLATVITSTPVELLVLKKKDFDKVLKTTLEKQWTEIKLALTKFPYFSLWDDRAVRECCITSDIKRYKEYDIVLGLNCKKNILSHFVLEGRCIIAQKITIEKCGKSWKLSENQTSRVAGENQEFVCMHTTVLNEGACFAIGEDLTMRSIIADSEVTILRIPQFILEQHNTANIWSRLKAFHNSRIPSTEEVFKKFLDDRKWEAYCKTISASMKSNNSTTLHDVPPSIRAKRMHFEEYSGERKVDNRKSIFRRTMTSGDKNRISMTLFN